MRFELARVAEPPEYIALRAPLTTGLPFLTALRYYSRSCFDYRVIAVDASTWHRTAYKIAYALRQRLGAIDSILLSSDGWSRALRATLHLARFWGDRKSKKKSWCVMS